jgi:hypothetical protein
MDLRTQYEVALAMAVVEHKRPEFRSERHSWNTIKMFSLRRNSSQEKTEGLPNDLGKILDVKYEGI